MLNVSKCPDYISIRWMDENLEIHEARYNQQRVRRNEIAPAVKEPFNVELEKALLYQGIKHPLIAISNTFDNWDEATAGLKNAVDYNPHAALLIVYGNQRLRIFDKYDFNDNIPVFVANNHVHAILIHNRLQQMIKEI